MSKNEIHPLITQAFGTPPEGDWESVKSVCERTGIPGSTLRYWIYDGHLAALRIRKGPRRGLYVKSAQIDALVDTKDGRYQAEVS